MKLLLILIIKFYWKVFPKQKRNSCLYRESCSKHVFRITKESGGLKGLKAFNERLHNCRAGFQVIWDERNKIQGLRLKGGSILSKEDVSQKLIIAIESTMYHLDVGE